MNSELKQQFKTKTENEHADSILRHSLSNTIVNIMKITSSSFLIMVTVYTFRHTAGLYAKFLHNVECRELSS